MLNTCTLFAQDNKVFDAISKDQKKYFKKHIIKEVKKNYRNIINVADYVRTKVYNEISKENLSDVNILEGYDLAYGNLYGLIWNSSFIYTYQLTSGATKFTIKKVAISEVGNSNENYIRLFKEWNNDLMSKTQSCGRENINGKYYIGSKAEKVNDVWEVKTIAFCD